MAKLPNAMYLIIVGYITELNLICATIVPVNVIAWVVPVNEFITVPDQ